ncbi:mercuric transporter MerT family protein [Paraglaciecola polaris]|jgi:mercuric ion transport protein|uniref:Mercuric transport protein MerT n=1 Tax=Paraglaciecola polaris LMG 21857 TaxID=1129793 RepID=K6ZCR0_9ALTE|nr:mercuric transporter MerT family protein [Paraglaciecola polaris]GAC33856.1 mercuric transport protein [Paraglaciecola polaris LMG 21857]|tara:strand:- start:28403 stop:28750 length:348 start_codon:yes stop_codon:yes gene_type:complete
MNQKESNLPMVGAIIAAIGAGVCCVGPLLLLLLGISGSWISNLSAFEAYRPLFILAVMLLLSYTGWKIYRPIEQCESGRACAIPATRSRRKVIFWLVTVTAIVLLTSNDWILCFV